MQSLVNSTTSSGMSSYEVETTYCANSLLKDNTSDLLSHVSAIILDTISKINSFLKSLLFYVGGIVVSLISQRTILRHYVLTEHCTLFFTLLTYLIYTL